MIISITGIPGSGKTMVSKLLSNRMGARYVNITSFIRKHSLGEGYDKQRKAMIVDTRKLKKSVLKEISKEKKNVVIDSHLSHFLNPDICIVLRIRPDVLEKRLEKRRYQKHKIHENVSAEILDIIASEALEKCKLCVQIDNTGKTPNQTVGRILNTLCNKKYKSDKVNWMKKYGYYLTKKT